MNKILENRTVSGFPVSIGTSMSLETVFSPVQEVYDAARQFDKLDDINTYSLYLFNVSTLLRNIYNSVKFNELITVSKKEVYETLLEEVDFLTGFFQNASLNIKFYIHNYAYLRNNYNDKLRKATTDKQLFLDNINKYCLDEISKNDDVETFSKDIKYSKEDHCLIFTHIPFDLISYNNFMKMDLLESHTGLIKTRKNWNTKYHPVPNCDMSILPFMEYLLVTFGDNVQLIPSPIKERLDLYNSLKKKNVHPLMIELSFSFLFGGNS